MGPLAAFLFATPIFGLSLQIDPSYLAAQQQAVPAMSSSVSDLEIGRAHV